MWRARLTQLFAIDLRSLALFRMGLGCILLYDWCSRIFDFRAHYTDFGILPRMQAIERIANIKRFSLFLATDNYVLVGALFVLGMLAALALIVGYRARLAMLLSWILLVSVQVRNPTLLQGGDDLLRMLAFWAVFLPLGAFWSIDKSLHPQRFPDKNPYMSVASAALLLQLAMMYLSTGILKSGVPWRSEYSAVMYTLQLDAFARPLAVFLRQFPELCKLLTMGVVYFEIAGPLLLFSPIFSKPLRLFAILGFIGLQLGLFSCMRIGHFPFVSTLGIIPFIPGDVWTWLHRHLELRSQKYRYLCQVFATHGHADALKKRCGHLMNYQLKPYKMGIIAQCLLLYPLGLVMLWNFNNCKSWYFPDSQRPFVHTLYLDQNWSMFAPRPLDTNGWYRIAGKLDDGTAVMVDHEELVPAPIETSEMATQNHFYTRERWRKYFLSLPTNKDSSNYLLYGRFICRTWNEHPASPDKRLKTFKIVFHSQLTRPDGSKNPKVTQNVWEHRCYDDKDD